MQRLGQTIDDTFFSRIRRVSELDGPKPLNVGCVAHVVVPSSSEAPGHPEKPGRVSLSTRDLVLASCVPGGGASRETAMPINAILPGAT